MGERERGNVSPRNPNAHVTQEEYLWREWVLGEGRFKRKGPRSDPRPPSIRTKIPKSWWGRLEQFLVARNDHAEKPGELLAKPRKRGRAPLKGVVLSPHFSIAEFNCHDGRRVPVVAVPALKRLCVRILEPMRAEFGPAKVMSGYRPRDYNARIGGAKLSQHIYDLTPDSVASDIIFARGRPRTWAAYANKLGAGGVGTYSSFVHLDNRAVRARWSG